MRLVVVGILADADPVLSEIDADDLIGCEGLTDMGAEMLRTPGMARSSLLARVVMRNISGSEVSGEVTQCIRKSRSLNAGSNECPSNGQTTIPARVTTATVMNAGRGVRVTRSSKRG